MRTYEDNWKALATNGWCVLISISVFLIVLLVAIAIGAKRGFYAGLMSLGFNFLGFILGIIVAPLIIEQSISTKQSNLNLMNKLKTLKPMLVGVIILGFTAIFGLIGEIVFLCLKAFFKRPIIKRKNKGESVIFYRSMGAIASGLALLPGAILMTNLVGFVDQNSAINKINNKVLNFITIDQAKGVSEYAPGLMALSKLKRDDQLKKEVNKFFQSIFDLNNYVFQMTSKGTSLKATDESINDQNIKTDNSNLRQIHFVPLASWSDEEIERLPKVIDWLNYCFNDEASFDLLNNSYNYPTGETIKYYFKGVYSNDPSKATWNTKVLKYGNVYYYKKMNFGGPDSWSPATTTYAESLENKFDFKTMFSWNIFKWSQTLRTLSKIDLDSKFEVSDSKVEDFTKIKKIKNKDIQFKLNVENEVVRNKIKSIFYKLISLENEISNTKIDESKVLGFSTDSANKNQINDNTIKRFQLYFDNLLDTIMG